MTPQLEETTPDSGADHVENTEYNELVEAINSLLQELDEESQSIFIMKKELGMSLDEISSNTGLSERTIRRRMHKVLEHLQQGLKNRGLVTFLLIILALFLVFFVV
jgi:RNA polymerase sigma factor (sigma-70 family)